MLYSLFNPLLKDLTYSYPFSQGLFRIEQKKRQKLIVYYHLTTYAKKYIILLVVVFAQGYGMFIIGTMMTLQFSFMFFTIYICPFKNLLFMAFKILSDASMIAYFIYTLSGQSFIKEIMSKTVLSDQDRDSLNGVGMSASYCALSFLLWCTCTFLLKTYYDIKFFFPANVCKKKEAVNPV